MAKNSKNSKNERYEQNKEVGSGSFGNVYLVIDQEDNSKFVYTVNKIFCIYT